MKPLIDSHRALQSIALEEPLPVTVRGSCMAPLIAEGALVEVRAGGLHWPGDVLVVQRDDGNYLAHRLLGVIWRRGGFAYLTCPDAGNQPDRAVSPSAVLGRVVGGDCEPDAIKPSLTARITALFKLCRCGFHRLRYR